MNDTETDTITNAPSSGLEKVEILCTEAMIAEHQKLREEILKYNDEIFRLENFTLGGIALLYSWLYLKNADSNWFAYFMAPNPIDTFDIVLFLPLAISIGLIIRLKAYSVRTARIGMYVAELETKLCIPGWERNVWSSRFEFDPFTPEFVKKLDRIKLSKYPFVKKHKVKKALKDIRNRKPKSQRLKLNNESWSKFRTKKFQYLFVLQLQGFWKDIFRFWWAVSAVNTVFAIYSLWSKYSML